MARRSNGGSSSSTFGKHVFFGVVKRGVQIEQVASGGDESRREIKRTD